MTSPTDGSGRTCLAGRNTYELGPRAPPSSTSSAVSLKDQSLARFCSTVHRLPDFSDRKPYCLTRHLYANDTQVYGSCPASNVDAFFAKLTACSCAVASWMQSNIFKHNADIAEVLWCATTRRQHQLPGSPLLVDGTPINPVQSVRDLGIFIGADLVMRTRI